MKRLQDIIDYYVGGCDAVSEEDHKFLYTECIEAGELFDDNYFRCENCSWWCDIHMLTSKSDMVGMVCTECVEDEDDE